jgi:hypothetical protein
MKRIFLSLLIVPAAVVFSAIARGQNLEQEPLALAGTLKGVAPGGVLQVAANEKEVWNIKVEANPQDISFSGTAEKTFLKPGMFVELRGQITKRGVVMEPVSSLTVFTPSDARPVGVEADGPAGGDGGGLFNDAKEEKKPDPKEKKATKAKGDDTVYRIAGAVSKVSRGGEVTVSAGGAQVKFNLAEECKISVDMNELTFASAGDKVNVQGWFYKGQPGNGVANRKVEITAANPLTDGSKKKPVKPAKESKTPAKGAKGEKGDKDEKPADEPKGEGKKEEPKKEAGKKVADKEPKKDA